MPVLGGWWALTADDGGRDARKRLRVSFRAPKSSECHRGAARAGSDGGTEGAWARPRGHVPRVVLFPSVLLAVRRCASWQWLFGSRRAAAVPRSQLTGALLFESSYGTGTTYWYT
eukprot:COSAG05_NODE_630_length_8210_cov_5.004563_7_plen_115_part_00